VPSASITPPCRPQHDDVGEVAGNVHQSVGVAVALAAMFLVDAAEAGTLTSDDEHGEVQGPAKGRRAALADLAAAVEGVAGAAGAGARPE
jgi:hypothetical protein